MYSRTFWRLLAVVLAPVCLFINILCWSLLKDALRVLDFKPVQGQVQVSEVLEGPMRYDGRPRQYGPCIVFRYHCEGQDYEDRFLQFRWNSLEEARKANADLLQAFPKGREFQAYYDPKYPSQARLLRYPRMLVEDFLGFFMALCLNLIWLTCLLFWRGPKSGKPILEDGSKTYLLSNYEHPAQGCGCYGCLGLPLAMLLLPINNWLFSGIGLLGMTVFVVAATLQTWWSSLRNPSRFELDRETRTLRFLDHVWNWDEIDKLESESGILEEGKRRLVTTWIKLTFKNSDTFRIIFGFERGTLDKMVDWLSEQMGLSNSSPEWMQGVERLQEISPAQN